MKFLLIIILSSMFMSCNADTQSQNDTLLNIEQQVELLKSTYRKVSSAQGGYYEQEYFNAFPNSFISLNKLFGYSEKELLGNDFNYAPLYEEAHQFISSFYSMTTIDKKDFLKKVINISVNGRWYADGVSYFQHGMQEKIKNDLFIFCELLSAREDKEIRSFWNFYFDNPSPVKEIPEELKEVKQINEKIYTLMGEALKKVQEEWEDLGTNR